MKLKNFLSRRGMTSWLAQRIGAHTPDVSDWKHGNRRVPVVYCVAIERATGGQVTRKDLRPDDWHLIWPELEGK